MALLREAYQALEDIVGKRNISENKGVCESYRNIPAQSSAHYGPSVHWTPCPQAVVLPGTTEEVQNIVRICNKYGIEFKAGSTFWATMAHIGGDNAIQLDMRRMKSVEIDQKNMTAIVEPYAIAATIQAEAMKVGLNLNIPGVGCSSSTLASSAGWAGFGPASIFMGANPENLLGAEWVLPNGEVLRTGSLGSGDGWFCGEGPGPSLRGMLRGIFGTAGAMGVCTKISTRLHPWEGPTTLKTRGVAPAYKADLGDNFRTYTVCFPTWEDWAGSVQAFHESDVLYIGHRQFNMFGRNLKAAMIQIITDPEKQLCDLETLMQDEGVLAHNEKMKLDYQIVIHGFTKNDMEYKEKAVETILAANNGWKHEMMLEKDIHDFVLLYLLRLGHKNLNYVMCGSYEGTFGMSSNVWKTIQHVEEASAMKLKWEQEHDHIAATGGDSAMGGVSGLGGGGATGWEFFVNFDGASKESIEGTYEFTEINAAWSKKMGFGADFCRWNSDVRKMDGYNYTQDEHDAIFVQAAQPWVFAYQYQIRNVLNPNNLCGSYFRTLNPEKLK